MDKLFSTDIIINNNNVPFQVNFVNEAYVFTPNSTGIHHQFSLRREHDEWIASSDLAGDVKNQAVEALDKYLLKQH